MVDATHGVLTPGTLGMFSKKTRDTILATSLVLFNQRGFGSVTTASIAEQAGILEGSLWYHFRAKQDLLEAHIELLEKVFARENAAAAATDAATVVDTIFRAYDVIWDFRYLLRDDFQVAIAGEAEVLGRVRIINDFLDQWTEGRMRHAQASGLLRFDHDEAEDISEIILVMGRYWMDFSHKKYPAEDAPTLRRKGLSHIFTVLKPYLSAEAATLINARLLD